MRVAWLVTGLLCLSLWSQVAPALDARAAGDLGTASAVEFPITCNPAVRAEFERGVALLHSFFYEEARRAFSGVAEHDPPCAMAQWGIAQTWWHPIWTPPRPEEFASGRLAAERASSMQSSPRERGFIEAIAAYYSTPEGRSALPAGQSCHGPVGTPERVAAYEREMYRLHRRFPQDLEVQVFYAFSVLSLGYATPADRSLSLQKKAGVLLLKLWKENPRHPGIAHYIIHSYDYPSLAPLALPAANAYASIAPWVPHALHMPSHIYTRLGMWDESIATNVAAAEASRSYAAARGRNATESEELHALDYLMYSYLQEGRDNDAGEVLVHVNAVQQTFPEMEFAGAYALAAIPARFVLERKAWPEAAVLQVPDRRQWAMYPFLEALFEYAHALGRIHTGDFEGARRAIDRMQVLRDATVNINFDYFKRQTDVQMQAASAWLNHAQGNDAAALDALRSAAETEDALGKHPVMPGALMPVREQLATLLLELGRPHDALAAYRAELLTYPGRFSGLYGAGLAAEQSNDASHARHYFETLAGQATLADTSRPEMSHVREYLAASTLKQ